MFEDPQFWLAVSFIIFVFLVRKPVGNLIANSLDQRTNRIRSELEEIEGLKVQAEQALAEYECRQEMVEEEIKNILEGTEHELARMKENATREVDEYLDKKTKSVAQRISVDKLAIIDQLRQEAIDNTVNIIREVFKENLSTKTSKIILQKSLNDINKILH